MEASRHPDMGKRALYMGMAGKIIAVTRSHRECIGGYTYAFMPDGERCLSKAYQYIRRDLIDFAPEMNEIMQTVVAANRYNQPLLAKG